MENFEICIRVIIRNKNKILVCLNKNKNYYFFPGGHLEFGESIKDTLFREIKEELNINVKKFKFIGVVDNLFREDNKIHHEIDLVFDAKVDKITDRSQEDHIGFCFFDKEKFSKEKVLPIALQKGVLKWLKDKKVFCFSQIYNKTIPYL